MLSQKGQIQDASPKGAGQKDDLMDHYVEQCVQSVQGPSPVASEGCHGGCWAVGLDGDQGAFNLGQYFYHT